MDFLPPAFAAMYAFKQFIVYMLVPSKTRQGKTDKLPVNPQTRQVCSAHDSGVWMNATDALATSKTFGNNYGVGFVFTSADPFWFIDIDECLQSDNQWSPLATSLLQAFQGAAVEVSASNRGLHIIGSGSPPAHSCKNIPHKLEFYTDGRFVALTGTQATGDAAIDCSVNLPWLTEHYFPLNYGTVPTEWTDRPRTEWNGPTDDEVLISMALRSGSSQSVFGTKARFRDLWEANVDVLARAYPDPTRSVGYDESSADSALAQHLAFWTGNDCERMQRIMWQSKLVRDKWGREDYLPRTITGVCGRQREFFTTRENQPILSTVESQDNSDDAAPKPRIVDGTTFLSIDQQIVIFTGAVYVSDEHKALVPGGYLLNPERFQVMYGGFSMPMDTKNEKVSKNAWDVFTQSQAFRAPRANTSCFRPDLPPASIIERDGETLANVWWPVVTPRTVGDVTPFLNHLSLLCPDTNDQMILISYLAAIVQHKGVKFQWCPLIQGVEGNGKTLLTRCVAFAIGNRYTHYPKAAELASKFNDWLYGKIFIAVEDIFVSDGKLEIMEAMKPMITSERQEIEPKGGVKVTRDICANFLINTNHKDGLRKTNNDRRFAPFYTAQQSVQDLKRDGMWGDYFPNLYEWLKKGGYAIVSEFLHTFQIPIEFNPALGCKRSPFTASTVTAIKHGLGGIEQEVMEVIEQGMPGFKNGWVSSMALDRLLDRLQANRRVPQNRRRELLLTLGYEHHPGLKEGRVNNPVMPDNGKPRLYIHMESPKIKLTGAAEIAKEYERDQK